MSFLKQRKGFVGPLGDDLPSIFPIVAAVVLFAGTLALANNLVNEKNKMLETRQAALGLSYISTEKGLINKRDEFKNTMCDDYLKKYAASNRVKFLVTVKRYCDKIEFYYPRDGPDPSEYLSPKYLEENNDDTSQGRTWAYCTNVENPPSSGLLKVPQEAVVFTYPVAVPCRIRGLPTNGLGLINVMAWK